MWLPLHMEYIYIQNWEFILEDFTFSESEVPLPVFFDNWVGCRFYLILEWLLQLVSSDHFLGKLLSSLWLWGSLCLFPLQSKSQISSLGPSMVVCLFLFLPSLGLWIIAMLSCAIWLIFTYKWVHTMHVLYVWNTSLRMIFPSFNNLPIKFRLPLFLVAE